MGSEFHCDTYFGPEFLVIVIYRLHGMKLSLGPPQKKTVSILPEPC